MSYYEMEPASVYGAGRNVSGLTGTAAGLAKRYLRSIDDSRVMVHHHVVKAALDRYRDAWHRPVQQVAQEVDRLGGNASASAVVVADADQDGAALLTLPATAAETEAMALRRPING